MQTFDIKPIFRSAMDRAWDPRRTTLGFDHTGFPDYNLLKTGENDFRITMAVPGYDRSEINIETRENVLWVQGQKETDPDSNQYLYQGIRERRFERSFQLPDHVKVTGAHLGAGLLHIELARELPESMRPRRIEIDDMQEVNDVEDEKVMLDDASKAA